MLLSPVTIPATASQSSEIPEDLCITLYVETWVMEDTFTASPRVRFLSVLVFTFIRRCFWARFGRQWWCSVLFAVCSQALREVLNEWLLPCWLHYDVWAEIRVQETAVCGRQGETCNGWIPLTLVLFMYHKRTICRLTFFCLIQHFHNCICFMDCGVNGIKLRSWRILYFGMWHRVIL
jgi:hypothetical protein